MVSTYGARLTPDRSLARLAALCACTAAVTAPLARLGLTFCMLNKISASQLQREYSKDEVVSKSPIEL